jgi:hypothetical protein
MCDLLVQSGTCACWNPLVWACTLGPKG